MASRTFPPAGAAVTTPLVISERGLTVANGNGLALPHRRLSSGDDPFEAKKDELIATASMLKRRPTVQHFAEMAAFLASDRGAGTTASIINVNSGLTSH